MKKKLDWKTFAGLTAAAAVWLKLSKDFPVTAGPIGPPEPVCAYPNLTYIEIQTKLLNLDQDLEKKRISIDNYTNERAKLLLCRQLI